MAPLIAGWSGWPGGDAVVLVAVVSLAAFGFRQGLFVTTLVAMQMLVSFLAALGFASVGADVLTTLQIVPPARLAAVTYLLAFLACVIGIRLAIGAWVPEMAVPLGPKVDAGLGLLVGALAGYVLAGAMLVAWSLGGLPGMLRYDGSRVAVDAGVGMLGTFARCVEPDGHRRHLLLVGSGAATGADAPRCSEPFLDTDGDGRFTAGERFLDVDRDGAFTARLPFTATDGGRRRALGLLECHRLGAWEGITVWHVPEITSPGRERLATPPDPAEPLYRATVQDADGPAGLVFSLHSDPSGTPLPVKIDPGTGAVSLIAPLPEDVRRVSFTLGVTDPTGLATAVPVLVTW